jgi:5,10-methylenetetrahydromethanopterin reductase
LEQHVIPCINRAAHNSGKSVPKIIAGLPSALIDKVDAAKEKVAVDLKTYGVLTSYRAMLARECAAGPADVCLLGNESEPRKQIQRLRDIGVTDFDTAVMYVDEGAFDRTLMF